MRLKFKGEFKLLLLAIQINLSCSFTIYYPVLLFVVLAGDLHCRERLDSQDQADTEECA